jgi:protein-disulfide isomerase
MALVTGGALVAGIVLVAFLLLSQPGGSTGPDVDLREPVTEAPVGLADGRALGVADAPVSLEIWSDFQCPACGLYAQEVEPRLISQFVTPGTLRLVYRDFAFLGERGGASYDESVEAATAARCAADQGRFWPYHAYLFANQRGENEGAFRAEVLDAIAAAVGLDRAAFAACREGDPARAATRSETAEGEAQGVYFTPTLSLQGRLLDPTPSYDGLATLIRAAAGPVTP